MDLAVRWGCGRHSETGACSDRVVDRCRGSARFHRPAPARRLFVRVVDPRGPPGSRGLEQRRQRPGEGRRQRPGRRRPGRRKRGRLRRRRVDRSRLHSERGLRARTLLSSRRLHRVLRQLPGAGHRCQRQLRPDDRSRLWLRWPAVRQPVRRLRQRHQRALRRVPVAGRHPLRGGGSWQLWRGRVLPGRCLRRQHGGLPDDAQHHDMRGRRRSSLRLRRQPLLRRRLCRRFERGQHPQRRRLPAAAHWPLFVAGRLWRRQLCEPGHLRAVQL